MRGRREKVQIHGEVHLRDLRIPPEVVQRVEV